MRRVTIGLASLIVLGCGAPRSALAVEVDSKAEKITITGRIQTGWYTSSIKGEPGNEFLVRRARAALRVQINDWISGMVEPDFASGSAISLKDCYFRLAPHDNFDLTIGQMKRRFDLFELTSSTQILVIERDGRIGRTVPPSLSTLTETLQFADRDQGLFASLHTDNERIRVEGAITNGVAANTRPVLGAKAFQGRVSFEPLADEDFAIHGGLSVRPYRTIRTVGAVDDTSRAYAPAFEVSAELGNFTSGLHVQAGFVAGTNPTTYNPATDDADSFLALQAIGTYKHPLANKKWFEAVEPVFRFSYADPNTDVDDNGGILLTPGVNLYIVSRTRFAANLDIFLPQQNAAPAADEDTEVSFKAASWLYF
jgi:hypothetical protein